MKWKEFCQMAKSASHRESHLQQSPFFRGLFSSRLLVSLCLKSPFSIFFRRALQPRGWMKEWHFGVHVAKNRKLVGFIIRTYQKEIEMTEINFPSVHKKLRSCAVLPLSLSRKSSVVLICREFSRLSTQQVMWFEADFGMKVSGTRLLYFHTWWRESFAWQ
jgi:hypothetical protein